MDRNQQTSECPQKRQKAFETALDQLANDPIRYAVVIGAFFPDMVREMIRDQMADAGITEEDIRELLQKAELLANPCGLSIDVLNDDTGDLLGSQPWPVLHRCHQH